jgi:hypothetical protein
MFDLSEIKHNEFESNLKEFDAEIDYNRHTVRMPIPRTKVQLELKIFKDDVAAAFVKQKNKKENKFTITSHYEKMIYSVNGNSDRQYVKSYIDSMSALDSRYLRAAYSKIVPGVDFACTFECNSCDHEDSVEVPLTAEFFWPKS